MGQDVFIVDNGEAGIWVWCGRKASKQEKREGMANASVGLFLHPRQIIPSPSLSNSSIHHPQEKGEGMANAR